MARKVIDTYPDVTASLSPQWYRATRTWTRGNADEAASEFMELVKRHVVPHFDGEIVFDVHFVEDARCEHCNSTWTEDSPTYNGGCCDADEIERLLPPTVEPAHE